MRRTPLFGLIFPLLIVLFVAFVISACSRSGASDLTSPQVAEVIPIVASPGIPLIAMPEGAVDLWCFGGEIYTNEVDAQLAFEDAHRNSGKEAMSSCWHWTQISGTWYVRHCGLSLSQECYTYGSHFTWVNCTGPGGPGGDWATVQGSFQ